MRYSNGLKKELERIHDSYCTEQGFVLDEDVQERLEFELKKVNKRIDEKVKGYDEYQMLDVMFDFADKLNDMGYYYREDKRMPYSKAMANDDTFRYLWEFEGMVRETGGVLIDYCEDHNIAANANMVKVAELVKKSFGDYLENWGQKKNIVLDKTIKKKKMGETIKKPVYDITPDFKNVSKSKVHSV